MAAKHILGACSGYCALFGTYAFCIIVSILPLKMDFLMSLPVLVLGVIVAAAAAVAVFLASFALSLLSSVYKS